MESAPQCGVVSPAQTLPEPAPLAIVRPSDFPDDPRKWDGWSKYRADNPYERLCLDPRANATAAQIQQHCTALLQWWQKKLPLKNQPSNPLAQMLRPASWMTSPAS